MFKIILLNMNISLNKFNLNAYLRLNLKFCSLNCVAGPYKFLMPEMICTLKSSGEKNK